jgi:hypothetical protein
MATSGDSPGTHHVLARVSRAAARCRSQLRRVSAAVILTLAAALLLSATAAAQNALTNAGFEDPVNGDGAACTQGGAGQPSPGNWLGYCGTSASTSRTTTQAHNPGATSGWSANVNLPNQCDNSGYFYQDTSLDASSDYEFSAWFYPVSGTEAAYAVFGYRGGDSVEQVAMEVFPEGTSYSALGASGSGPPVTYNAWHQLKVIAHVGTSGYFEFFVDGLLATTSSPVDNRRANPTGTTVFLGWTASCNPQGNFFYDDVYLGSPTAVNNPPATTVTSGPAGTINAQNATFSFSASDPAATFECSLDGGAFSGCSSPYTTPPLAPGPHTFSVRARNADGPGAPASRSFTVAATTAPTTAPTGTTAQALPPPVLGQSVNTAPVSGTVLVRLAGTNTFVKLVAGQQLPVGSTVDTTRGVVRLTSAADKRGGTQSADFYQGIFVIRQQHSALTDLLLTGGSFARCPAGGSARKSASSSRRRKRRSSAATVRKLWGDGQGKFQTSGRYSSAAVRGTIWLVADQCDGTLTKVRRGTVTVRDLVRKRTVIVKAPKSYLARRR